MIGRFAGPAVVAAVLAASLGAAPLRTQSPVGLNLVILVDVTSSLHLCPGGVAGLPSSTAAGSGATALSMRDYRPIPPAVGEFPLKGLLSTDRVRIGAITRKIAIGSAMPGDAPALRKAWTALFEMPPLEWMGPSPIWDATAEAVRLLAPDAGRRAIILITDGQATANRQSYRDVAVAARGAGIPIAIVGEQTPLVHLLNRDPLEHLRDMAAISGGQFLLDRATEDGPCFVRDPGKYLTAALGGLR